MFKEMIVLQSAFQSGLIGDLLTRWEQIGFFSYLLPFLIIFALVFGILTKVNVFKDNKMVNGIIALAVALMALQFDFVPTFFSQIFPRLGVGLSIILGIMIIMGLFLDEKHKAINWIMLGVSVIIFYFILVQSAGATGWTSGQWWQDHWGEILAGVLLVIFVIALIGSQQPKQPPQDYNPPWARR
jgi:peptidoglycan/LPS O-acetylase OafA/YrhL